MLMMKMRLAFHGKIHQRQIKIFLRFNVAVDLISVKNNKSCSILLSVSICSRMVSANSSKY